MNKKILVGIVALCLAGGMYYMYTKKAPSNPDSNTTQSLSQTMSEASQFAAAVQSGKPTTCTLTKGEETMEYRIKGKMMRVNMQTLTPVPNAGPIIANSHMINDGTYAYIWSDGQKQGSKMSLTQPSPTAASEVKTNNETPKLESESDYDNLQSQGYTIKCQAGSVNDADFVPPSDIQFIDPTEVMKQVAPTGDGRYDIEKLQQQYGSMIPQDNQ